LVRRSIVEYVGRTRASRKLGGPARRLPSHTIGEFFSAPIIGDRPALRLVVDNDRSKTAP
jgi:hypothetical protein